MAQKKLAGKQWSDDGRLSAWIPGIWQPLTAAFTSQGIENFKKEFEQLRRAFRYDEFETVTNANPPSNSIQKVLDLPSCSSQPACLRWWQPDVCPMDVCPMDHRLCCWWLSCCMHV